MEALEVREEGDGTEGADSDATERSDSYAEEKSSSDVDDAAVGTGCEKSTSACAGIWTSCSFAAVGSADHRAGGDETSVRGTGCQAKTRII